MTKTQLQLCREAEHKAVLRAYGDFIRKLEAQRGYARDMYALTGDPDLLAEVERLEAVIDRQMSIMWSM